MPIVREYRVVLPMSLEEFERGRRWHKVEQIKLEQRLLQDNTVKVTEFGERTLLREETKIIPGFSSEELLEKGKMAEHQIKGFGSASECSEPVPFPLLARIGSFIDIMITNSIALTQVESWDAYPYFRSVSTNSSLETNYQMIIEGICVPGSNTEENPLHLPESLLGREVILIDIASDVSTQDYRDGKDPILFRSAKTGRGPLKPGVWMEETKPCITCYILVNVHFNLLGPLGYLAEKNLQTGIERAMKLHHRELFCYIDEWIDFSLEELRQMQTKMQAELEETVRGKLGNIPGNCVNVKSVAAGGAVDDPLSEDVNGEKASEEGTKPKGCPCPIEYIKKKFSHYFSACAAGGSVGYANCVIAFAICFLAIFLAAASKLGIF